MEREKKVGNNAKQQKDGFVGTACRNRERNWKEESIKRVGGEFLQVRSVPVWGWRK